MTEPAAEHRSASDLVPDPTAEQACPCGTAETYRACCGRFHAGEPAPTPEALMRSRYSANALLRSDPTRFGAYLHQTWAPETRPGVQELMAPGPSWCRLTILGTSGGGPSDSTGTVEFVAAYTEFGASGVAGSGLRGGLRELSRFRRESGRWFYVDGDVS